MGSECVVDRLILGHMPLVGVSYQSRERDAEYWRRFSDAKAMRKVVNAALEMGVKRFAAASPSSSPLAPLHLQILKDAIDEGYDIELIPCVGYPSRYKTAKSTHSDDGPHTSPSRKTCFRKRGSTCSTTRS